MARSAGARFSNRWLVDDVERSKGRYSPDLFVVLVYAAHVVGREREASRIASARSWVEFSHDHTDILRIFWWRQGRICRTPIIQSVDCDLDHASLRRCERLVGGSRIVQAVCALHARGIPFFLRVSPGILPTLILGYTHRVPFFFFFFSAPLGKEGVEGRAVFW